ncbi:ubiquinone biosynthesis regulatory protein kinase UbiB [Candidatus Vondammii sp. HM_W22]|uniref:ubiquinone biosynthesis regulatory protein kinase UbiB n=1 Tax=Candidatus Vondammii sp. HM_W22 TaxID=2687299 RepID=UPI001F141097|nr:ubiquinone biosynthesis regulatory protein kinase UbiB [Candidatus Vondammii sp. HM_W22]
MIRPTEALRLLHINWVLLRHGLDEVILVTHLFRPFRFILYLSPWYWLRRNKLPAYPVRMRRALEDLGPIFVKFGQILSTRRDLLPDDIADELALLQDAVPPFPGTEARKIIEQAFGHPIEELLDEFDETPLASASIAQVHTARLKTGKEVIVKVLRPGIEKVISRDVSLLYLIAGLASHYWKEGKRLRPLDIVEDYEKTIFDELDMQREAANAAQLRRNWEGSDILFVPEIYWDYTRKNVLVMERIHGTPVGNIAALKAQGINMKQLGEQGVEIFFTQVFRDNFFHADMHPGNIFVEPSGRYIAVDFGIVGSLSTDDQRYLAENLLAFFNRDYYRVAELHVESGWVPKGTRIEEFESAIRSVCEPIFNKPLSEISFGHFLLNLFQTARRFDMEVQPQLVLLQKTLLYIEGLGRQLYPELDLWSTAKPYIEHWMKEQVGPKALARKLKKNLPQMTEYAADIPLLAHKVLSDAADGRLEINWKSDDLKQLWEDLKVGRQNTVTAISGASMLISGALLLTLGPSILLPASIVTTVGLGLGGIGGLMLAQALLKS